MTSSTAVPYPHDVLGEILVGKKLIEPAVLATRSAQAVREKTTLEAVLLRSGEFSRAQLLQVVENFFFCPSIDVTRAAFSADALKRIPRRIAERHEALPIALEGDRL